MTSKRLGALLRSVPPATAADIAEAETAPPAVTAPTARKSSRTAPAPEPEVPLQVLIPANIRKQLAHKAAEEGQSLRALMLRAIRSLGVTVTDDDIKGKRGRRSA